MNKLCIYKNNGKLKFSILKKIIIILNTFQNENEVHIVRFYYHYSRSPVTLIWFSVYRLSQRIMWFSHVDT